MPADEIMAHRLMMVVSNEVKKEVLLKVDEPDLISIMKIMRRYEAKQSQDKREKEMFQVVTTTYKVESVGVLVLWMRAHEV